MILICEEYCFQHHLASATEKVAARERFHNAVEAAGEDGGLIGVREVFHTAQPLKRGTRCGELPQGVTVFVHLHASDDSRWTDLTQQ